MKVSELPELYKQYILVLSDGTEFQINGVQKEAIINSTHNFATLPNGSVINKAFIMQIKFNIEETRDFAYQNKDKIIPA